MSEPLSDRYMERILTVACCLLLTASSACGGSRASSPPPVYDMALTDDDANVAPVYLRLVAPDSAVLERAVEDGWEDVCSRCNGYVPALGLYRVRLADGRETRPFRIPHTDVVLTVDKTVLTVEGAASPQLSPAAAAAAITLARFMLQFWFLASHRP